MEFIKLDIYTTNAGLEPLSDKFLDLGVSGFEFHDAEDFMNFIKGDVNNGGGLSAWEIVGEELEPLKTQETYLTLYLTTDSQGEELLENIKELLSGLSGNELYGEMRLEQSKVREEDWAENWKAYFKPFEVGEKLLIKPTWEEKPATDRLILEIDPASAFGTGQHESTKLCLEALENSITPDCTFLDLGCGSGILTIAALLLGAKHAVMVDVSENAVKTACENVAQNKFTAEKYTALCGDITENAGLLKQIGSDYNVIAANIVADVIIKMSRIFPRLLKENGRLIVSGIIEERLDEVVSALKSAGLKIAEIKHDNSWCLIKCKIT